MGYSYLKSNPIFKSYRTYYAVYNHVGGLASGTPVSINGFPVGKILNIRFLDKKGKLLVTFSIENDFQFSKSSKAELYDTGIIGGKAVQIIPVFDNSQDAAPGDTLPSSIRPGLTELVTQKLTPLQEKLENMLVSTDSLLIGVNEVLNEKTRKDLKQSISDLSAILANFKRSSETLNTLITDNKQKLNGAIENTHRITENLSKISDQLAQADYEKTMKNMQSVADNFSKILSKIESGEGTLGKLFKDEKMYTNLTEASKQLDLLLEDMRLNPKRYVHFSLFGKRAKTYEPTVEEKENE
jgi:phospholipid/cholesterol/gamma-HCH transport system substrate-binding protein